MAKPEVPQSLYEQAWALAGGCVERPYNQKPMHRTAMVIARTILAAKAEEREACASLADATADELDRDNQILHSLVGRGLALAMRKRGS